jgi:hypothetical protein
MQEGPHGQHGQRLQHSHNFSRNDPHHVNEPGGTTHVCFLNRRRGVLPRVPIASRPCRLPPLTCPCAELASRAGPGGLTCSWCRRNLNLCPFPPRLDVRCGGAAEGTGAERHASVRPGCIRELAPEILTPEKELPVMLVAVFLANCCKTEWVLASERRGGRESAVASTACLHCCTLPSPPPPSVSVSRVCLLLEHRRGMSGGRSRTGRG